MPATTIGSVDKACKILKLFSNNNREWGTSDISKALGWGKSTVQKQVSTLERNGFLKKDPATGRYSLGLSLFELGSLVLDDMALQKVVLPSAERLCSRCDESVHIGILDDGEVVSIHKVDAIHALRPALYVGKRAPFHCTALGKCLVAFLPRDRQKQIIAAKGLQRYTDQTITSQEKMLEELDRVRRLGYAVDDAEHEEGCRCVGAPVFDHSGRVIAAISAVGPSVRITLQRLPDISRLVMAAAAEISLMLGYRGGLPEQGQEGKEVKEFL